MELEKIGENDKVIFYKNMFTKDYGDGYKIVLIEEKGNGRKTYLLLKDDEPIYENQNMESIYWHKEALDLANKE